MAETEQVGEPARKGTFWRTTSGNKLHLGSQDLIRLAAFAAGNGFTVDFFIVADADLTPLNRNLQDKISAVLIEMLHSHGGDEIEAAMREEHDGLYIVGVELISAASGDRILAQRRGLISTSNMAEADNLLDAAWRALQLS
jgi:hypothetical protein